MFESKELLGKVDYFDQERTKIWSRLSQLEDKIHENASTHEKEAKQPSRKAAEFRNRAEKRNEEIETIHVEAETLQTKLNKINEEIDLVKVEIDGNKLKIDEAFDNLNSNSEKKEHIDTVIEGVNELIE